MARASTTFSCSRGSDATGGGLCGRPRGYVVRPRPRVRDPIRRQPVALRRTEHMTNSKHWIPRAKRARARGVASVEAVVALPFLLLVLVCVSYVRTAALEERKAAAHARSCAWKYSQSNCDVVPPGCSGVVEVLDGGDAA